MISLSHSLTEKLKINKEFKKVSNGIDELANTLLNMNNVEPIVDTYFKNEKIQTKAILDAIVMMDFGSDTSLSEINKTVYSILKKFPYLPYVIPADKYERGIFKNNISEKHKSNYGEEMFTMYAELLSLKDNKYYNYSIHEPFEYINNGKIKKYLVFSMSEQYLIMIFLNEDKTIVEHMLIVKFKN